MKSERFNYLKDPCVPYILSTTSYASFIYKLDILFAKYLVAILATLPPSCWALRLSPRARGE